MSLLCETMAFFNLGEGCNAWGLSSELGFSDVSTLGLCVGVGDEEIGFGTLGKSDY